MREEAEVAQRSLPKRCAERNLGEPPPLSFALVILGLLAGVSEL